MLQNINLDQHHHIVVKGATKFSWEKAEARALQYYEELEKNNDGLVSRIAQFFYKQIEEKGLYEIFRQRYDEEFGTGRSNRPLPYHEGEFHCILLLNPFIYTKAILKKVGQIDEQKMFEVLGLLGPICSMASIGHTPINSFTHNDNCFNKEMLEEFSKTHWQLREYLKTHTPLSPNGTEMLKLSRMQTPSKAINKNDELFIYKYRGLGFGKTLINTVMFASSIAFPEEEYLYFHARAGLMAPCKEGEPDVDWVVPFYEHLGAKWITTFAGCFAFNNDPFLNIVMRLSIEKNTGKIDHILLINDK